MSVLSSLPAGSFAIDASHSRVGFSARHAMVTKVRGSFNDFAGIVYNETECGHGNVTA